MEIGEKSKYLEKADTDGEKLGSNKQCSEKDCLVIRESKKAMH